MHFIQARSILSASNGMNIYRGCSHGCIYCDARSKCYQMDHAFEDIAVKENALELLEMELRKKRKRCMIGTGAMSDPYMHIEKELCYTRRFLELVEQYGFGATILTKSNMVLRDIDLIDRINRKTKFVLQMTFTTYDEELRRIVEPNVCTTRQRYEVLKECQKRGIPTVVWMCPILPYVNDTMENLDGLMEYCRDAGVYGIVNFGFGLTLRDGDREYFYKNLDKYFPGLKQRYIKEFGNAYEVPSPDASKLWYHFRDKCKEYGIEYHTDKVFAYLHEFEDKASGEQMSLF